MAKDNPLREKDRIDRGAEGDKVPGFDPGAAPLGTDDEAAGTPHPTDRPKTTGRIEQPAGQVTSLRDSIAPDANPRKHRGTVVYLLAGVLLGLVLLVVAWAVLHYH